mmetsp:Transcript_9490/g.22562  ORF Transcript_9490/g.22562 Transcript_9490/m.22562 type:complete len:256 (+) Transcript_9490:290-1057(+)
MAWRRRPGARDAAVGGAQRRAQAAPAAHLRADLRDVGHLDCHVGGAARPGAAPPQEARSRAQARHHDAARTADLPPARPQVDTLSNQPARPHRSLHFQLPGLRVQDGLPQFDALPQQAARPGGGRQARGAAGQDHDDDPGVLRVLPQDRQPGRAARRRHALRRASAQPAQLLPARLFGRGAPRLRRRGLGAPLQWGQGGRQGAQGLPPLPQPHAHGHVLLRWRPAARALQERHQRLRHRVGRGHRRHPCLAQEGR